MASRARAAIGFSVHTGWAAALGWLALVARV